MPDTISIARSGVRRRPETSRSRRVDPSTYSHHDVRHGLALEAVLTSVVDGDHCGVVVEGGGRVCLTPEPGLEGGVAGEVAAQHLHRDRGAAQPRAARPTPGRRRCGRSATTGIRSVSAPSAGASAPGTCPTPKPATTSPW